MLVDLIQRSINIIIIRLSHCALVKHHQMCRQTQMAQKEVRVGALVQALDSPPGIRHGTYDLIS